MEHTQSTIKNSSSPEPSGCGDYVDASGSANGTFVSIFSFCGLTIKAQGNRLLPVLKWCLGRDGGMGGVSGARDAQQSASKS